MRPELEADLWNWIRRAGDDDEVERTPREWIRRALDAGWIDNAKQAWATLRKWGLVYDYGVTMDLGWFYENTEPPPNLVPYGAKTKPPYDDPHPYESTILPPEKPSQ